MSSPARMISTAKVMIAGSVGLIVGTVGSTLGTVAFVESQALKVARPLVEARVAPLEKIDLQLQARVQKIEADVIDQRALDNNFRRNVMRKLDALCRAAPKANCPLGDGD